ncbi:MAG: alkaline phosphatase [Alkalispirochaeta sp.]
MYRVASPRSRIRHIVFRRVLLIPIVLLAVGACSGKQYPSPVTPADPTTEAPETAVDPVALEPTVIEPLPEEEESLFAGARRVILVIGDGMGAEQIRAASLYKTGREEGLALQSMRRYADMATSSASHAITDSAAAGTALATAVKVQNGAVGVRLPGDGEDIPSITEQLTERGWRVGLVTTAHTTHATPAAFGAHVASRIDYDGIARDYLTGSRPHVILGGGGYGMDRSTVMEAGYAVVTSREELSAQVRTDTTDHGIVGLFGNGHMPYIHDGRPAEMPGLVEMSERAIEFLAAEDDEFFLMIEGARIDHAGHANDIERLIPEVLELDAVVEMLLNHPELQDGTLLVVTADHETGGLSVVDAPGARAIPRVTWSTLGHTAVDVPLFAAGVGAEGMADVIDNTLLSGAILAALEASEDGRLAAGSTLPVAEAATPYPHVD